MPSPYRTSESVDAKIKGEDFRFWKAGDDEAFWQRIASATARISERTASRRQMDLHHAEMYGSMQMAGLSPQNYEASTAGDYTPSTLSFNVVRRTVDAVVAKTAKNKPLPMYLTQKGDPAQQAKAKKRNGFINGAFYETKQYPRSKLIARDAGTWGTGIQSNYALDGKICSDRVFPWDLRVDPNEAMYGTPRTIYQYRWVDRYVLAEMFPEHEEYIIAEASCTDEDEQRIGFDTTSDQLLVKEAWHLRSGPKAKDGVHGAMIEGLTLLREEYTRDYFPFSVLKYKEPLVGYFGTGIAQELQGIQYEINAISEKVQEGFLTTGSYWWLPDGSKVLSSHMENGLGIVVRTSGGTAPTKYDPPSINADNIQYLQMMRDAGPNETGLSGLSMAGEKPAGLNSGKALETYNDIESETFVLFGQAYEEFHIDVARQYIDLAREMGGYKVRNVSGKTYEIIDVKDADFTSEDDYVMQCFPTSFLANTPSDRFQQVQDLQNAGYLTPDQAKSLLQFPDIESEADLDTAPHRVLLTWLSDMVEDGKVRPPEPLMNFADAMPTAIKFYWKCQEDKQPEDVLGMVRDFITQLQELQHPPPAEQAPAAAPGALMPGGVANPNAPPPAMAGAPAAAPPGAPPMPPMQ